ncbi:DUF1761 domain-containing protein [Agromyces sp. NPDC056379]|uniref:DUF1761 domain-containing protein n=1 Tax=unclassified Agromyces TaxID=2639701 RepID=UPI0035DDA662
MLDSFLLVNWAAVAVATALCYVLGALWFTPFFGRAWDRALGTTRVRGERFPPVYYLVPLASCLLGATAIGALVVAVEADGWVDAVVLGLLVGVGLSAAVSFTDALTPVMPHPLRYGAVTGSYHVLCSVVAALVVTAMP